MTQRSKMIRTLTLVLALLMPGPRGLAQTPEQPDRATNRSALKNFSTLRNGVYAYIYGYPLLMFGTTERVATSVPFAGFQLGAAPLNQFGKEEALPNSSFTSVVLPSTTTLYASAFLNLASPVARPSEGSPRGSCRLSPLSCTFRR
jgi:hypothetical protein